MGLLRLLLVDPQVVFAGGVQPLMAEDFFDVDNGTAVEDQISGNRMPENMRSELLLDLCKLSVPVEEPPNIVSMEPGSGPLGDKDRLMGILPRFQIPPEPVKRAVRKEYPSFFVAFTYNLGLFPFPIDGLAIER